MNKNYFLYSNYTTKNTNMFFTTPIMKKLKARNTVQQYLRRNNLRIDNITSIREIVKETRSGMVFNTLVPEDSKVMKNCTSQVDGRYIDGNLRKVKKRFDKYFREENERFDPHDFYDDILLLTDTRTQERVGFAITQYGECNDMPSTHALKLICALPGYGELLLCSYLFTAKQQQDYGILELAGHFTNMRGLCLYNKLGFREDMLMKNYNCFGEMGTLPMKVNLSKIGYDYLDLVLESTSDIKKKNLLTDLIEKDSTSEPLCNKYFVTNPDDQVKLREKRVDLQKKFNSKYYRTRPDLMKRQSDKMKKDQESILKQALGRTMKTRSQSRESQPKSNRITVKRKRVIYSPSNSKSKSQSKSQSNSKSKSQSNSQSNSKSKSQSRSRTQSKRTKVQQVSKKPRTRSESKHSSTLRNYMKPLKHIKKWVKNTKGRKMAYLL